MATNLKPPTEFSRYDTDDISLWATSVLSTSLKQRALPKRLLLRIRALVLRQQKVPVIRPPSAELEITIKCKENAAAAFACMMQALDALRPVFTQAEADVEGLVKKAEWLSMHGNKPGLDDYGCKPGRKERQELIVQTAFRSAQTAFKCATLATEIARDVMDHAVASSLFGRQDTNQKHVAHATRLSTTSSNSISSTVEFDNLSERVQAAVGAATAATEASTAVRDISHERRFDTILLSLEFIVQRRLQPAPGRVQMLHHQLESRTWWHETSPHGFHIAAAAAVVVKVVNELDRAIKSLFFANFALIEASELRVDAAKMLAEFLYSPSDPNKKDFIAKLDITSASEILLKATSIVSDAQLQAYSTLALADKSL